ncbi:hypothetical protein KAR91_21810 [Candidatus Pacearchaeota archaeon]|nr:hypothetical protein [Candidatus Pacearchaeota archaeon]
MPEEPLIQKYWYKGNHPERPKLVTRSYTKNARNPSPAQATQRLRVSDASRRARGMKREKDGLPPAAKLVKRVTSGSTGMSKEKVPVWKEELDTYLTLKLGDGDDKERELREIYQLLESVGA